ncbi:hypothetical protein KI387_018336, partial [Taxus chinensis]
RFSGILVRTTPCPVGFKWLRGKFSKFRSVFRLAYESMPNGLLQATDHSPSRQ